MRQLLQVALDLLKEAFARRWVLALFGGVTLVLLLLGLSLQVEVVDGAIAGSKLFGELVFKDTVMADRVLGPVQGGAAFLAFFGGAVFLLLVCSDFAPELLAPGRIEQLLSLPIARWQLLFGTFLGVVTLAGAATLYAAAGLTVLLGLKLDAWSWRLMLSAVIGWAGFCAIYSAMLAASFVVRSAAFSGGAGLVTLVAGLFSSAREEMLTMLDPGVGRFLFQWGIQPFPRLGTLSRVSAYVAAGMPVEPGVVGRLLGGCALFAFAMLFFASWRFERRDF